MNVKDLTGKQFGRLTVVERTEQRHNHTYLWRCICSCGKECLVSTFFLTHGLRKSCGCLQDESRKINLAGQRFGRLLVIRPTGKILNHSQQWECLCDCGKTSLHTTKTLRHGDAMSCGCLHSEMAKERSNTIRDNNLVDGTNIGNIRKNKLPAHNTSGYRGISWHRGTGMWQARIQFQGVMHHLGYFKDISKAVEARRDAERQYFGEYLKGNKNLSRFSGLNF